MDTPEPANIGKSWTWSDNQALIDALATPATIKEIAAQFGRTPGAIVARQAYLAQVLVQKKHIPLESAARMVRMLPDEVKKLLQRAEPSKTSKPPVQSNSNEECLLSVVVEIRNLLRELVGQRQEQNVVVPTTAERRNSVVIKL